MSDPSAHRVYEADAVDRYIAELHQQIDELKDAGASEEAWRTAEATLGRAMLTAQRQADETLAEAAQKAREIIEEAEQRASDLHAEAARRVQEANDLVAEAERQAEELRASVDLRAAEAHPAGSGPVLTAFAPPRAAERVGAPSSVRHLSEVRSAVDSVFHDGPERVDNNWPPPVGKPEA